MKREVLLSVALTILGSLAVGCFRQTKEEAQLSDVCWLKFPDLPEGTTVNATGDTSFRFVVQGQPNARYALDPGTYRVTATQAGTTLMDRKIFLAEGETRALRSR